MFNPNDMQDFMDFMQMYQMFQQFKQMQPGASQSISLPTPQSREQQPQVIQDSSREEVSKLQAEISKLQGQVQALQAENQQLQATISSQTNQLKTAQLKAANSFIPTMEKVAESQIEGQMTLEGEMKYLRRHGKEGQDNWTKIMDQLSKEDREKVREMYYADSDGVFSLEETAKSQNMSFEQVYNMLHPDNPIGDQGKNITMTDFTNTREETNELGF